MYIKVYAITSAKKEYLEQKSENSYIVSVKEKAERNMANSRILELVARQLKVPQNKVRIINGHHHKNKLLSVDLDD